MNYLPLFLVYNPPHETLGEKFALSGEMLLRGLGTVFLVLIILWGVIELFNFVSTSGERAVSKKVKAEDKPEVKEAPVSEPVKEIIKTVENEPEIVPETDDGAVIAAIIAAIEAYRREEGNC